MVDIYRYNVAWLIPGAGPSVSVFHLFGGASTGALQTSVNGLRSAFDAIKTYIPDEVTVTFPPEVSVLDVTSGQLVDAVDLTPPGAVIGTHGTSWSAGSGVRVVWGTGRVRNGRKVRGSTYLVPLGQPAFNNSGQVAAGARTAIAAAFETWRAATQSGARPLVYSRPKTGMPGDTSAVSSVSVSAVAATLRGRKY